MLLGLLSTGFLAGLAALPGPIQQFFHSRLGFLTAIKAEIQFRRSADPQALDQLMTYIFARRFKAFETAVRFGIISFDVDPNFRGASIIGDMNGNHTHQTNARISQLAFHQGFDFFAKSLTDPPAMMLEPPLLQDAPQVKRLRISEKWLPVLSQQSPVLALLSTAFFCLR